MGSDKTLIKCADCGAEFKTFVKLHEHERNDCTAKLARLVREGKLIRG